MIEVFKDNEMRNSGVIYNSTLEQIKTLYEMDPEQAGELAISAIELVLTGDISSDDSIIKLMLQPMKKINENNQIKYDNKKENVRAKKISEMQLDKIAELSVNGCKQREIAERLGLTQQTVSYRLTQIKSNYPELLQTNFTKIQKENTNKEEVYQNTKDIKETDFCKNPSNKNDVWGF